MKLGFLWSLTLFSGVNLVLEALEAQLVMGKGGAGGAINSDKLLHRCFILSG